MCSLIHLWGKAIWPANDEYKALGRYVLLVFNPCRELGAAVLFAAFVEQHHTVARLQRLKYEFSLLLLLLCLAQFLGILQFRDNRYLKLCKMAYPFGVVLYSGCYVVVHGAPHHKQCNSHISLV